MRRLAVLATVALAACGGGDGPPVRIGVPKGSTLASIGDSLVARGILGNARWFRLRGRMQGVDRRLKPGVYEFAPGNSTAAILDRLARGDAVQFKITLPEGATLFDLARRTESVLAIPADTLLRVARDSALRREFGIPGATVEGWLRPVTFTFTGLGGAREVLESFLDARRAHWPTDWKARADAADLDQADVISLASIIEAEAMRAAELPRIAAVYRNRLRLGMPLQADPTIQYAYLVDSGARKPRLYNKDYAYPSPYNSYLHPGLPPTPIGNPSDAAIEAVLSPTPSRELYFVAVGDGTHLFAVTYAEHLRNIKRVRSR
ncbi:MAG: endolytic transglycosylase MltG [Gemmatimonadales bacterium]